MTTNIQEDVSLTAEQNAVFMEVIADSLHLSQRSQLFNWLQSGFQYLIGHEVMIFGVRPRQGEPYQFEYFTTTRYFDHTQFSQVTNMTHGLLYEVIQYWDTTQIPVVVTPHHSSEVLRYFAILQKPLEVLKEAELGSFIAHGFDDGNSFVAFARLSKAPTAMHTRILEMIMPHLHCAIVRASSKRNDHFSPVMRHSQKLTTRELEIIQWVHMGKTNWEISTILDISPLTVKNHVQNLIRKLDVQNRRQAALKAAKLGIIKP